MAANLFKLAGADVRVAEADNVNNTEADAVFKSITATSIANFAVLAADANGKIIEVGYISEYNYFGSKKCYEKNGTKVEQEVDNYGSA